MTAGAVALSAAAICVCSLAAGYAVWRLAGFREWSPLVGPLGLATIEIICGAVVHLPGRRTSAAVLVLIVVATGVVLAARSLRLRDLSDTLIATFLGAMVAALPFFAWGRVGILGVTDNADMSAHLLLADGTGSGHKPLGIDPGWYTNYPTGPHALVGTLHGALRVAIDAGFNGLMIATLAMSVCAALALVRDARPVMRFIGALVGGIPFLGAFYIVQSSFKEPLLALVLVTWTLLLPLAASVVTRRPQAVIALAPLAAAAYATYSFVGLVWLAAATAGTAGLWLVHGANLPRIRWSWRTALVPVLFLCIVIAVAIPLLRGSGLAGAVSAVASGQTTGGNITSQLAAYQVFGLWPAVDARTFGASLTLMRALGVLGAAVAIWAAWFWWWRERRPELPGAALGAIAIYALIRGRATPYYSAKALVMAGFVVGLMMVGAIVLTLSRTRIRDLRGTKLVLAGAGVAVLIVAAWSSTLVLRGARVEPKDHREELASLRPLLLKGPTLYMGQNDYLSWYLRGAVLAFPYTYITPSQLPIGGRPEKVFLVNRPFDWDSQVAEDLDRFRFVLTSRAPYTSAAPPNWRLVRTTPSYAVWERTGPTAHRGTLQEPEGPGAVLNCQQRPGAQIGSSAGQAAVRSKPIVVPPRALRLPGGKRARLGQFGFATIDAGRTAVADVSLPPGRWTASLQYVSPVPVELKAGNTSLRVPASMEGPSMYWRVGTFDSPGGQRRLELHADSASPLASFRTTLLGTLALTPADERDRVVPLKRACGRYVDWLRLDAVP